LPCTGIPLIDAGMRELWHTGWMHNRVRMIDASFLSDSGEEVRPRRRLSQALAAFQARNRRN
jgi:FAD binding domain of DNA photolyase